jgi:hypothetical protein
MSARYTTSGATKTTASQRRPHPAEARSAAPTGSGNDDAEDEGRPVFTSFAVPYRELVASGCG